MTDQPASGDRLDEILEEFGEQVTDQWGGDTDKESLEGLSEAKSQLRQYISDGIGADEPWPIDDREWDRVKYQNQLRREIRQRLGL